MNYIKSVLVFFFSLLITTIIFGSLSYFNIINEKTLKVIQIIVLFIMTFIESYNLGKKKEKKGYIEGLIYGSLLSSIFIILNIILKNKISIYKLLLYLIIIVISTIASILGINRKMKD